MQLTKQTIHESYTDPEFEAYYETLEKEQLALAEVQAKHDGAVNDPKSPKHYLIKFITPVKHVFQKGLDFNFSKFQPLSDVAIMQNLRTTATDKVTTLIKEKNDNEKKAAVLKNEQKGLKAKLRSNISLKLRRIIPVIFGGCEGFLVFNMLQSTGLPFFVCLFWGVLTMLVTSFGLLLAANFICKTKTNFQLKLRWTIVLVLAFGVALALGIWRASTYNEVSQINSQVSLNHAASHSHSYSPWPFVVLSFVSFLVALAFKVKYWINDDEKKKLKAYEDKCAEVNKAEKQRADLEYQIDRIKSNSASDSASVMRKQEYACGNEQRLLSLAKQVVSRYESVNVEFRKDGHYPEFFGEPIDFGFQLYFTKMFYALNQKQ